MEDSDTFDSDGTDGSDADYSFDGEDSDTSDDSETFDIYDEIENLRAMQENLSNLISENRITHEEYNSEMLRTNYYIDVKTKTYVLTGENQGFINKLRKTKEKLINAYKYGDIDETQFYLKYNELLRTEYTVLKMSESSEPESKRQYEKLNLELEPKLKKLHDAEIKHMRTVGAKLGVYPPKIPVSSSENEIDLYSKNAQNNRAQPFNKDIHDYIQEYTAYKQVIDYNSSSFEIARLIWSEPGAYGEYNYEFKVVKPLSTKLSRIKTNEKRSNLLSQDEQRYSDRIGELATRMNEMSRDELLRCVPARTFKYMSFIEKLKENKQRMFGFNEHPENYNALKIILGEENSKYYKIESDKIFKDYVYSRPDLFLDSILSGDNVSSYQEKGSVSYLAIKEGANRKDLGNDLENFITVKPMDDELFLEIQEKTGDKTSVIDVWELRTSLSEAVGGAPSKGDLVKRYTTFTDYIYDLKTILSRNSKKIPRGKTRDILLEKIRKIYHYLNYETDPDLYNQNGHESISELFKNRADIYKSRESGIFSLTKLIGQYYQYSSDAIDNLERDIFNFSTKNYDYNVSKVLFILKNYQDKLTDIINGAVSGTELLSFETPMVLPPDDIDLSDKEVTIISLLNWKPNTPEYDYYTTELTNINHDIIEFKKNNPKLTNLEINQLLAQYSETVQWKSSLDNYQDLKVPAGSIELNFRVRYLLKQRNRLPSRRIYRIVTISGRLAAQQELISVFKLCKIRDPEDYARITETIIYNLSKSPEEYLSYKSLIKREYSKICKYFSAVNVSCTTSDAEALAPVSSVVSAESETDVDPTFMTSQQRDYQRRKSAMDMAKTSSALIRSDGSSAPTQLTSGTVTRAFDDNSYNACSAYNANIITPIITEFIITQGDFSSVDIERLAGFARNVNSETILKYIKELRDFDIDVYDSIVIDELNKSPESVDAIYLNDSRKAMSFKILKQNRDHAIGVKNKYISPVVTQQKPVEIILGKEYIPDYVKVGEFYVHGGFYPDFMTYHRDKTKEPTPNYSREDLEKLAGYFNVPIVDNLYDLFVDIIKVKNSYNMQKVTKIRKNFEPLEYNTYYDYLKLPTKNVTYTTRPRLGVEEPGEVYAVVKDLQKMFGVPFEYTSDNIAIYSSDLKKLVDDSFIIIEGPCIFKDTYDYNTMTSDSYILVEYSDSRGKAKLFREGVAKKRVITKKISELDTCSRFSTQGACDNNNSHSLEVKGLKFKCKWLKFKCGGVLIDDNILKTFVISEISFDDDNLNTSWKKSVEISINYVENLVKMKELTREEIKLLTTEQKSRLYKYYMTLLDSEQEISRTSLISADAVSVKSYTMLDMIGNELKTENTPVSLKFEDENYRTLTIYKTKPTVMKYSIANIKLGEEYTIDDNVVIPREYVAKTDSFICDKQGSDVKIVHQREEFRRKSNKLIVKRVPVFCIISNDDYNLLSDVPGYYWYIDTQYYDETVEDKKMIKKNNTEVKTFVPTCFIEPSGELLNGKPLITQGDIFDAINRTGFNKLTTNDEYIYEVKQRVNATSAAIDFAIRNKIDINKMLNRIIGTIELVHVIEEYENSNPRPSLSISDITEIMERAVNENDFITVAKHYVRAVKSKLPKELLKAAKAVIDNSPKPSSSPEDKVLPPQIKPVKPNKNKYVSTGRR